MQSKHLLGNPMNNLRRAQRDATCHLYQDIRPRFMSGDIIAQSNGDWKSFKGAKTSAIRIFTMSTYSHVGVIEVDPRDKRVYLLEQVVPRPRRVLLSEAGDFYHLRIPGVQWGWKTSAYASSLRDEEYSQLKAMKSFFVPLESGDVSNCAAYTREIMKRAGVDLGNRSRPDAVIKAALSIRGTELTFVANGEHK